MKSNRDVDEVIEFIRSRPWGSETEKQVMIDRLDPKPTKEELDAAYSKVCGKGLSPAVGK